MSSFPTRSPSPFPTDRLSEQFQLLRRTALGDFGLRATREVARSLTEPVQEEDGAWLLELYFELASSSFQARLVHPYGLLELLDPLPVDERVAYVRRSATNVHAGVRRAAFELAWRIRTSERVELLLLFRDEAHPAFARRVRSLLELEGLLPSVD